MGFFVDRHNRRKSALALYAFSLGLVETILFLVLNIIMSEWLYYHVSVGSVLTTNIIHACIVGIVGSCICCLLFLLKDKQIAPYSAFCFAAVIGMLYAAALLLDGSSHAMIQLISIYYIAPVLICNLICWSVYAVLKKKGLVDDERKTIAEELKEAIQKENEKQAKKQQKEGKIEASVKENVDKKQFTENELKTLEETELTAEEAMFGPESRSSYPNERLTAQEEAMLLFTDDEEA